MARSIQKRKKGAVRWRGGIVPAVAAQYGLKVSQKEIDPGLSPKQVASILGVTAEAVQHWMRHQHLPAVQTANGQWRVSKSGLERFLRDRYGGVKHRVLVAGLDDESVGLLREIAGVMGLDVVGVSSAFDALLKMQQHRPALCIVDCSAPEYGWDFVERIRSAKSSKGCPVVVVAGTTLGQAELDRALALGVQACLVKPLTSESLRSDIERLWNRRM